eukprot:UN10873
MSRCLTIINILIFICMNMLFFLFLISFLPFPSPIFLPPPFLFFFLHHPQSLFFFFLSFATSFSLINSFNHHHQSLPPI